MVVIHVEVWIGRHAEIGRPLLVQLVELVFGKWSSQMNPYRVLGDRFLRLAA